jgi:threonine dehydratase
VNKLPIDLSTIQEARHRIIDVAHRTPLFFCPGLSSLTKNHVYLKLESHQPIRVFKIRGAANKILKLSNDDRKRGLIAASSGNHGLAVSYLAHLVGTRATIIVPTNAVEEKVKGIEEYGAKVIKHGLFHDERFEKAEEIRRATGAILVPPFDDSDVIAGQGTIGLEILEDLPNVQTVIVPIGGGGLIAGISTAIKSLKPAAEIIGVEPERASSMYQSIKNGRITRLSDTTSIADGLATREPGELTYKIASSNVDRILLVNEEQIERAVFTVMKICHLVVEPSAAAAFAALVEERNLGQGKNIVVVVSGGNISLKTLSAILAKYGQSLSPS